MAGTKRVILFTIKEDQTEIRSLIDTMGYDIVEVFYQKRRRPDPNYYLGKGRFEEVQRFLGIDVDEEDREISNMAEKSAEKREKRGREREKKDIDAVIVDDQIKPAQHYRIERGLKIECMDRTGLILNIFNEHAHTKEAKLQVELARLQYQLPLIKEWVHRAKEGEKPGFMGGGAYAVDVYYEMANRRIGLIKKIFKDIEKDREIKREIRRKKTTLVALAGYTNAGKSTLLRTLSGDEDIFVDDRLFSTLSPVTRRAKGERNPVLFTDTVGFIDNLPTETIKAFMSTIEEIFMADIVILVFDISDPEEEIRRKLKASIDLLLPEVGNDRIVYVANKIDLLSEKERERKMRYVIDNIGNDALFVSALDTSTRNRVMRRIYSIIKKGRNRVFIELPAENEETYRAINRIKGMSIISSIDVREKNIEISAYVVRDKVSYLEDIVSKARGRLTVFPEKNDDVSMYV